LDDDARAALVRLASGDARRALTALEAAASVAGDDAGATAPAVRDAEDEDDSDDDDDEDPGPFTGGGDELPVITADHIAQAVDRA
ncbi:hypothetical protein NPN18_25585, partial [Vibrio parahaemolyticus]|nr:hypothetical protein [Vibrio parahaemolyticus]